MRKAFWAGLVVCALVGCEGTATGQKAGTHPVEINIQGGYGPIKLSLTTDMSPVAINLNAGHGVDPSAAGKWNTYRATLSRAGVVVGSAEFHMNYTGGAEGQPGSAYQVQTMLITPIGDAGDYDFVVTPVKPNEFKLTDAKIEVRRNVQLPPPGRNN